MNTESASIFVFDWPLLSSILFVVDVVVVGVDVLADILLDGRAFITTLYAVLTDFCMNSSLDASCV